MAQFIIGLTGTYAGTDNDDTFTLLAASVNVFGLGGNDRFELSTSLSTLDGGTGNDTFDLSLSNQNAINAGDGNDAVMLRCQQFEFRVGRGRQ